jgi:radical SAM superfamily enzyme YgiQ (UPF0313 family)/ADP-ribosylglycohydrolase
MKVALLMPPTLGPDGRVQPVPCSFPGWGLALLAAHLRQHGHGVSVPDLSGTPAEGLRPAVRALDADLVGIAVHSEAVGGTEAMLRHLAETRPQCPVVLGGHHVSHLPHAFLSRHANVRAIVQGEGEEPLLEVVDRIERGDALAVRPGLALRDAGGTLEVGGPHLRRSSAHPAIEHLDLHDITFDIGSYARRLHHDPAKRQAWLAASDARPGDRGAAVFTTLGCPHRCNFCSFEIVQRFRRMEPDRVSSLLDRLQHEGVRHLLFYDAVFLAHTGHARGVCEGLLRRERGFRWTAQTTADHTRDDLELIPLMARAGLVSMGIGIESGSPRIRASMGKDCLDVPLAEVVAAYRRAGVLVELNVMLGAPDEDDASVLESCGLFHEVPPESVGGAKPLRLYPGSAWFRRAQEEGRVTDSWDWARDGVPTAVFHPPERHRRWEDDFMRHREYAHMLRTLRREHSRVVQVGEPPVSDSRILREALRLHLPAWDGQVTRASVEGPFPPASCILVFERTSEVQHTVTDIHSQLVDVTLKNGRYRLEVLGPGPAPCSLPPQLLGDWQGLLAALPSAPDETRAAEVMREVHASVRTARRALTPPLAMPDPDHLRVRRPRPAPPLGPPPCGEALRDRLRGAWLGRVAGCTLGVPCEGMSRGQIRNACGALGQCYPLDGYWRIDPKPHLGPATLQYLHTPRSRFLDGSISGAGADDDLVYVLLGLHLLETHALRPTTEDIARAWVEHLPYACTAEHVALANLRSGIPARLAAECDNPYQEWIGAAIRADAWGWAHPGDPEAAARLAFEDAVLTHRGDGVHAAMFVAASLAAAFASRGPMEALQAGLAEIPADAGLAVAVRRAFDACERLPDAAATMDWLLDHTRAYPGVHVLRNVPLVVAGLVWGDADLERTLAEVVMAGEDTDSNAATAGSLVGALRGAAALPARWIERLEGPIESYLSGLRAPDSVELVDRFMALAGGGTVDATGRGTGGTSCTSPS